MSQEDVATSTASLYSEAFSRTLRAVGTGAAGPAAAGPMFNHRLEFLIQGSANQPQKFQITSLRTLDSFTTCIWTRNETTYSTYLAAHAHMDVTAFNMAGTHFPAVQFRPTKAFSFLKRQFGSKGDQRSFHAERCDTLKLAALYDVNAAYVSTPSFTEEGQLLLKSRIFIYK